MEHGILPLNGRTMGPGLGLISADKLVPFYGPRGTSAAWAWSGTGAMDTRFFQVSSLLSWGLGTQLQEAACRQEFDLFVPNETWEAAAGIWRPMSSSQSWKQVLPSTRAHVGSSQREKKVLPSTRGPVSS